jgi:AraC-like DNA-binding protein
MILSLSTPDEHTPLPGDLVRALAWLKAHLQEPVDIETVAAAAGVRPRTLETHFRQFLGTTPLGWVRRMRLAEARRRLLDPRREKGVTEIALASGFTQLGRFAAQYHQQFGELPSETRRRASVLPHGADEEVDDEAVFLSMRALTHAFAVAPEHCNRAIDDLARARELAPDYGLPKALAAWCIGQRNAHHFDGAPGSNLAESARLVEDACARAPTDAVALSICSGALALAHRLEDADALVERAVALDPASAFVWLRRGWISAYFGDSDAAIRELRLGLQLMPFEPLRHLAFIGIGAAHFSAGRYDRAARWARAGVESCPDSFWGERIAVAAAVHYGAGDEARRSARHLLREDPDLTVAIAQRAWPFPPAFMARLADGLARAGVPRH